jgi:hypothetical protein
MAKSAEKTAILKRAAESVGIRGTGWNKKLAEFLEVNPDVITHWKGKNGIDFEKLRQKLTNDQFLYATKGQGSAAPVFTPEDYVSRTEFLAELSKSNRRIDHLKRVLTALLHQLPGLDLTGIEAEDPPVTPVIPDPSSP